MDDRVVLKVGRSWCTPATDYPLSEHGHASITRTEYKRGYYHMEMVDGYLFWYNHHRIPVTELRIRDKIVMVDDPLHWIGIQRLAEASRGNVLVIGLGLGLIVHALAKNNKVSHVDVVEIDEDVVSLVSPLLPDGGCNLHVADGYRWEGDYDTVIVDILVTTDTPGVVTAAGFDEALSPLGVWTYFKWRHPNANVYLWGMRNEAINPAVKNVARAFKTRPMDEEV